MNRLKIRAAGDWAKYGKPFSSHIRILSDTRRDNGTEDHVAFRV